MGGRCSASCTRPPPAATLHSTDVVLVSQSADRFSRALAALCAPARFRHVPSIAHRLALVAVGEGEAGVSLNGPGALDIAGGHALLHAVGAELVDAQGRPVRYEGRIGSHVVFGGLAEVLVARGVE